MHANNKNMINTTRHKPTLTSYYNGGRNGKSGKGGIKVSKGIMNIKVGPESTRSYGSVGAAGHLVSFSKSNFRSMIQPLSTQNRVINTRSKITSTFIGTS